MSQVNKLYRNFIILQEDERGYSSTNDKTLSGYSKIEAKGERCKVSFYAQNLRRDSDDYCIMLICNKKDSKKLIDLGRVAISDSGKAEVTKEYYTDNIAGLNIGYDKISGAAIVRKKEGIPIFIMCGFMNGEQPTENWKDYKIVAASNEEQKPKIDAQRKEKDFEKKKEKKKEDIRSDKKVSEEKEESRKNKTIKLESDLDKNEKAKDKENKFDEYEKTIDNASNEFEIRGSVGEYFEGIANGFEEYRGGYNEIKHCKWYKVPVNDLYEMCNMSNYNKYTVAYYPMLNYYPYIRKNGHFMLGYKGDKDGNLRYLVYGIPGKKDKDEQPYEGKTGFVTWISDNNRDDMGCWLMFYDFRNSTVVVPMQ